MMQFQVQMKESCNLHLSAALHDQQVCSCASESDADFGMSCCK